MGSFREIDPTQFARYFLDVPYADEDPRQVMDVWLPNEGEGPFPLIVFVHGGGWQGRKVFDDQAFAGICRCLR